MKWVWRQLLLCYYFDWCSSVESRILDLSDIIVIPTNKRMFAVFELCAVRRYNDAGWKGSRKK
jgi:hypothetical protein